MERSVVADDSSPETMDPPLLPPHPTWHHSATCRNLIVWDFLYFWLPDYLNACPHCFETDHAVARRRLQAGGATELFAGIDLGDVGQEVEDTAGVAPLVVVPADKLDEVGVERDTGLGIEDGRVGVANEIARDDLVLGVSENA